MSTPALALIPRLTDGPDRQSLELALQLARANALLPLKGFNHAGNGRGLDCSEAASRRRRRHRFAALLRALWPLRGQTSSAAQMEPALALARQMVEVADRQDDTTYRLVGYRLLGTMQLYTGQNREALESLQRGRTIPRSRPAKAAQLSVRKRSRPHRPLLQDMGADVPRSPRPGGAS